MRMVLIVLAILSALGVQVRADNEGSEKFGRSELNAARKSGEILPLTKILEKLKLKPTDSVLEVEYEREGGKTLYEIYYLDSAGRRHELLVDAATGDIVSAKGKN